MNNDPELNAKVMGSISSDFIKVADTLKEAAYLVKSRGFSDYPIFPTSVEKQPVGSLLIGKEEASGFNLIRNYYISYLDEFVQRGLVAPEKGVELFKQAWRDPDEYCCLFVLQPNLTGFVFIPYPED